MCLQIGSSNEGIQEPLDVAMLVNWQFVSQLGSDIKQRVEAIETCSSMDVESPPTHNDENSFCMSNFLHNP